MRFVAGRADATFGDGRWEFGWASVTKLATAVAVLVAAEEGVVDLDEPAGPPGSTVRHLLAHASGLAFDVLGRHVAEHAGMPFAAYYEHVWGLPLAGHPGSGARGSLADLLVLARELLDPQRVARETMDEATTVQFAGIDGVLPGFGRQSPNDWGLGLELRDGKRPHWTGTRNSPRTFGHFGRSGTFLWVDPEADVALACLTDRPFGDWAKEAWPRLADAVLQELEQ